MLRLGMPTEAFWVDCPHGVRLLCRPLTTPLNHAAVTRARRRLRDMGAGNPEDPNVTDPDLRAGLFTTEVTVALAEVLVEAWEGVGNAEGTEVAPLSPDGLRKLMALPEVAQAFDAAISVPLARLTSEGNA